MRGKKYKLTNFLTKIGQTLGIVKSTAVSMPIPINVGNQSTFYQLIGNGYNYLSFDNNANIEKAIKHCPPVTYLPIKIAQAISNGKVSLVDKRTGEELKRDINDYLGLLQRPNYSQNRNQFITQCVFNTMLYGYSVAIRPIPTGFSDSDSIWILPNAYVSIQWKTSPLFNSIYAVDEMDLIESITFDGKRLPKEQCFIIKDLNRFSTSNIIPESRLQELTAVINNLSVNLKARGKMMNSPMGILSQVAEGNGATASTKKEDRERLQKEFTNNYGFNEGQSKIMIADSVQWQEMGYAIAQMQFIELAKEDINIFCEVFGYPAQLTAQFGNQNVSEGKLYDRKLYNETVIPYAEHIYQQLSENIIKEENLYYKLDFSHVGALQTDNKEESETRARDVDSLSLGLQNGLFTYGEVCTLLNKVPKDEWKDLYFHELPPELIATFRLSNTGIENPNANQNTNEAK